MLVKFSRGDGRWFLLDDARNVEYGPGAFSAHSLSDLENKIASMSKERVDGLTTVSRFLMDQGEDWKRPQDNPYKFNYLVVEHSNKNKTLVFFDHPAYLCDGVGNTIEKIHIR